MERRQQQISAKKKVIGVPLAAPHTAADDDPNFDRKLDIITAGAKPHVKEHLLTKITTENCQTIVDYMIAMQTEVSPSQTYRIDTILKLKYFSEFHHGKPFKEITRQDIIDFLDSFRKPETVDSLHKWVGTHEAYRIVLMRFFRWLYAPIYHREIEPDLQLLRIFLK